MEDKGSRERLKKWSSRDFVRRGAQSCSDLLFGAPTAERAVPFRRKPRHVNCIFRAGVDAVFFAPAVFGPGENGHEILRFQASRTTGRDAEAATRAGLSDNDRQPFVGQFFFHDIPLVFPRG